MSSIELAEEKNVDSLHIHESSVDWDSNELRSATQPLLADGTTLSSPEIDQPSSQVTHRPLHSDPLSSAAASEQKLEEANFQLFRSQHNVALLLDAASRGDRYTMTTLIRQYGVDPNGTNYDKRTALHLAASENKTEAAELLLELGANINCVDRFGRTPFDDAVLHGHEKVANFLRKNGGQHVAQDQMQTKLFQAVAAGDESLVNKLLMLGVNPNFATYDLRTPLHIAVAGSHSDIASKLLQHGANPHAKDRWDLTPLEDVMRRAHRSGEDKMKEAFASLIKPEHSFFGKFAVVYGIWEIIVIILFGLFLRYGEGAEGGITAEEGKEAVSNYPFFQDVHYMIFFGFGYLMTFLRRNAYQSLGLTFLLSALVLQWYPLVEGFWRCAFAGSWTYLTADIKLLILSDFCAGALMITYGVVLGKVSPTQMMFVAVIETVMFGLNERIGLQMGIADLGGSMVIHMFGAFFGLAMALAMTPKESKEPENSADNKAGYHSDVFAMIGTFFLWLFWPSFNGALGSGATQHRAVVNTLYSLTGSCVCAFLSSYVMRREARFNMVDIQNATLAGGVAMGTCADMVIYPGSAMAIGAIAGVVSVGGYVFVQPFLERKIGLLDTCGVLNLHGFPSIIAAVAGIIASACASWDSYGPSQLGTVFSMRVAGDGCALNGLDCVSTRSASYQAKIQVAYVFITLGISIVSGTVTGLLIRLPFFEPMRSNFYKDSDFWEVPELEIPYYFDSRGEISREPAEPEAVTKLALSPSSSSSAWQGAVMDLQAKIDQLQSQLDIIHLNGAPNAGLTRRIASQNPSPSPVPGGQPKADSLTRANSIVRADTRNGLEKLALLDSVLTKLDSWASS